MKQEKLAMFGTDGEDLATIIANQVNFNNKLDFNKAYDEIIEHSNKMEGFGIVTTTEEKQPKKPTHVERTENFQYFVEGGYLIIANKYF